MLKLELDWAGEGEPEYGTQDEHVGVFVQPGKQSGPAGGWPTVVVLAAGGTGAVAGPRLWQWLKDEYCGGDGEEASELASEAEWVEA